MNAEGDSAGAACAQGSTRACAPASPQCCRQRLRTLGNTQFLQLRNAPTCIDETQSLGYTGRSPMLFNLWSPKTSCSECTKQ